MTTTNCPHRMTQPGDTEEVEIGDEIVTMQKWYCIVCHTFVRWQPISRRPKP